MKKFILAIVIIASFGVSCSKKQEINNTTQNTVTKKTRKPTTTQTFNKDAIDCFPPAKDCASNVVVRPHESQFKNLNSAITSGYTAVTAFFNTSAGSSLSVYFGTEYISLLKNGTYTMIKEVNLQTSTTYYFIGLATTLNYDNAEYVLPTTM